MAEQRRQSIALDTESGVILGNVDELGILVRNLLDNALRYAGRGCRVAVSCARELDGVKLRVLDDGPGVAETDRDRIFDRFYRGAGNAERGSGIGLALVSRIAQSHGATIITGAGLDGRGFGITITFHGFEDTATVIDPALSSDDDEKTLGLRPADASS